MKFAGSQWAGCVVVHCAVGELHGLGLGARGWLRHLCMEAGWMHGDPGKLAWLDMTGWLENLLYCALGERACSLVLRFNFA